jgi:hypothetical protein
MSTLSQFAGSGIKSIQRGTTTANSASQVATISAVDLTKSIVIATYRNGYYLSSSINWSVSASAALTSATALTVTRNSAATAMPVLDWQVIEYF